MQKLPGGKLSNRPLHFFWLLDCSGSMSINGKIESLNGAVQLTIPEIKSIARDNPFVQLNISVAKFSHGAKWHIENIPIENFKWKELEADKLASPKSPNIDVVFLIDTSGSMSDEIEAVKYSCLEFANKIIEKGFNVELGMVGFDIGGHRGNDNQKDYKVYNLSKYTIGVWPICSPNRFRKNIQSLTLGLFGGAGCYLADNDTIDIFPHVIKLFNNNSKNNFSLISYNKSNDDYTKSGHIIQRLRYLIIISDEIGSSTGEEHIVKQLKDAHIKTHVLGVPDHNFSSTYRISDYTGPNYGNAHKNIATLTGGYFWNIFASKGKHDFSKLLDDVAVDIAQEATKVLDNGSLSRGTDLGAAFNLLSNKVKIPPMPKRAFAPIVVLISDGNPTDNYKEGLANFMQQPWGKKSTRLAIGIGKDVDRSVLTDFINHPEIMPLQANTPQDLVKYIKWSSTVAIRQNTMPVNQENRKKSILSTPPDLEIISKNDIW